METPESLEASFKVGGSKDLDKGLPQRSPRLGLKPRRGLGMGSRGDLAGSWWVDRDTQLGTSGEPELHCILFAIPDP